LDLPVHDLRRHRAIRRTGSRTVVVGLAGMVPVVDLVRDGLGAREHLLVELSEADLREGVLARDADDQHDHGDQADEGGDQAGAQRQTGEPSSQA